MQRPTRQSNGRRNYTRNSGNSFKFHNFVFNEDNQSFCLEEQHGNKKITVLHWKKFEERPVPGEEDSKPPEPVALSKSGKTISRQLSKTSSDSTSASKRRTLDVTTSASFPPPSGSSRVTSVTLSPLSSPSSATPTLPQPSLSSQSSNPRHLSDQSCLNPCDSFQSPVTQHLSKSNSQLERCAMFKSNASSSSIATSSSSSSSQVANWLNQSLNDLDLTELPNRSIASRRKPAQVRRIVVNADSDKSDDEDEDEDEDDEVEEEDEDSDLRMTSTLDRENAFQKYREYLSKFEADLEEEIQSQPLDLSTKTKRDHNNNTRHEWNIDSILGIDKCVKREDEESVCDSVESFASSISKMDRLKRGFDRLQVPSSVSCLSDWDSARSCSSARSEAPSPSALISSVKCCSPSPQASSFADRISSNNCMNPFMFPSPLLSSYPSNSLSSPVSGSHQRQSTLSHEETSTRRPESHYQKQSQYMFDTFLEEEISKMLASSSSSSKSPLETVKSEHDDIEERIEDKLRSLHREVLNRRKTLEGHLEPGQDHLKLHFKLDSNKNLESFGSSESRRNLSEPCLQQAQLQALMLSKGRPSQRTQIKRQLEDAFKQNGFLVKTKQVSDVNNSAMFCKFRQLRKYTRYYLKSWQNHLPDEVNKLWKGFLPPKTERPLYLGPSSALSSSLSSSLSPQSPSPSSMS